MINLFIVDIKSFHSDNGVKTYIKHLLEGIKANERDINISLIRINFTILEYSKRKGEITEYEFPVPFVNINVFKDDKLQEKYYNRIVDIIEKEVMGLENIIFDFNWIGLSIFSTLIKQRINCKTILTKHCIPWKTLAHSNFSKFIEIEKIIEDNRIGETQPTNLPFKRKDYQCYDKIITVTKIAKKDLIKIFGISNKKIVTIYNGIDISISNKVCYNRSMITQLRSNYGFDEEDKILLFVGREEKLNGFLIFLYPLIPLLTQDRKLKLIIVGGLNVQKILTICKNVWSSIIYTGYISPSSLSDLYLLSDIGIIPSLYEQCSYVALEMMQHNLPIIATKVGGLKEMIKDGYNGISIPIMYKDNKFCINESNLHKSIISLLEDQKFRNIIIKNAQHSLINKYSLSKMTIKTVNIYKSLLKIF